MPPGAGNEGRKSRKEEQGSRILWRFELWKLEEKEEWKRFHEEVREEVQRLCREGRLVI